MNYSTEMIKKLQVAQSKLAEFYQDVTAKLDEIAAACHAEFDLWGDILADGLPEEDSPPSESSGWDFLPLSASSHLYVHQRFKTKAIPGDFVLTFHLFLDENLDSKNWKDDKPPSPADQPSGKGIVEVYIYRCVCASKDSLWKIWNKTDDYPSKSGWNPTGNKAMLAWHGIFDLAMVMTDSDKVIAELEPLTQAEYKVPRRN